MTLGFALTRHISWTAAVAYLAAQLSGAAAGAGVLRALLGFEDGTGGTLPSGSQHQSLGIEIVLTFVLMFVIMAVSTDRRTARGTAALAVGGTVALDIIVGGPISGGSMNPARSFGPALAGWTWTSHWVYWAGPLLGAAAGAIAYTWLGGKEASTTRKRVLFACVHNSGRSQMAEAFVRHMASGRVEAESAGTAPSEEINPRVMEAMRERGIDLAGRKPKLVTQDMVNAADRVVTMGCSIDGVCPIPLSHAEDWGIEDPHGKSIEDVRAIRDEIELKVRVMLDDIPA